MNAKKMKLIETGVALFAERGYHHTSIQEIAQEAGISKGAFYLYFQSKEEFVTTAIAYFHAQMIAKRKKIMEENLSPTERLAKQIEAMFDYMYTYKGFIMMFLRESISIGNKADDLIRQIRTESFHWMRESLLNIYGDKIHDMLMDLIIQMDGLMHGYSKWMVAAETTVDSSRVGPFLVSRLDDLVNGMLAKDERPLVAAIPKRYEDADQQIAQTVSILQAKLQSLPVAQESKTQLQEALSVLKQELAKPEIQAVLIQGLLAHFQRYPELQRECEQIACLLEITLL